MKEKRMNNNDRKIIKKVMRPNLPLYQQGQKIFAEQGDEALWRFLKSLDFEQSQQMAAEMIAHEVDEAYQIAA